MNPRKLLTKCAHNIEMDIHLPGFEKQLPQEETVQAETMHPVPQLRSGHAIYSGLMQSHDRMRRRGIGE